MDVSDTFARTTGITVAPLRGSAKLGNDISIETLGTARVYIKVGSFQQLVECLVIDLLDGVDIVLGQDFMKRNKVLLDYAFDRVLLRKGNRRVTVNQKPLVREVVQEERAATDRVPLLSALQVKRLMRKRVPVFLATLSELKGKASNDSPGWMQALQEEFDDVFQDPLPVGLPPWRNRCHEIPTEPGHEPPSRPLYRLSPLELEEARKQVTFLLEHELIEPSVSPYGASILFVPKPNGRGLRMCVDYRALNSISVKNRYPLPMIDEMLDTVAGAKFFTSLDLTSGYWQIRIKEDDIPKTAFRTPFGLYQWRVMPFGLTNAPATFQSVMNDIFRPFLRDFVMVYLDDILIYSKTEEEHRAHVRLVLEVLRREKFFACKDKSSFVKRETKFLGHLVGEEGIKVDPDKVQAVQGWPAPKDAHQVKSFLGLANYFRRFIQGYSTIAVPLSDLTKSSVPFDWTPRCQEAFQQIKDALTQAPCLVAPDTSKPYTVVSDASCVGIGAVLLQEDRPVAFESRKLSPAEVNYTTGEQELLAVVHALTVWRCYLEGTQFTVVTDHCPNTYLQTQQNLSRRQARWSEFLQRFTFKWVYSSGRTNMADPLSRNPARSEVYLAVLTRTQRVEANRGREASDGQPTSPRPPISAEDQRCSTSTQFGLPPLLGKAIIEGYTKDAWLRDANSQAATQLRVNDEGYFLVEDRIYVPDNPDLRRLVIQECHDTPYSGHGGEKKTQKAVERLFFWVGLGSDVKRYVSTCATCLRNKARQRKPAGGLRSVEIPDSPWESISFDLVTDLPETPEGFDSIAVFVDQLTRLAHFVPTRKTVTAEQFARLYVDRWMVHHGLSDKFITDRDPRFTSKFWTELTRLIGTRLAMSSSFHPATDGLTERLNRTMETYLRHYVSADHTDWDTYLSLAEFAYNSSWQASLQATPFEVAYGRQPKTPIGRTAASPVPAAKSFADRLNLGLTRAKSFLQAAKQRQKAFADRNRREVEYGVGDKVLLNTKYLPIRYSGTPKFLPRFVGPFEITERIGSVAYRLNIPAHYRVHPVFHVSLLEPYRSDGRCQPPPPPIQIDGALEYVVERILTHRKTSKRPNVRPSYLVAWKGYGPEHNTWEPEKYLVETQALADYWSRIGGPQADGQPPPADGVPLGAPATGLVPQHPKRTTAGKASNPKPAKRRRSH